MDKMLLTQIIGVSFIFIVVAVISLVNVFKINYHLNKNDDRNNEQEDMNKKAKLYEVGKRK